MDKFIQYNKEFIEYIERQSIYKKYINDKDTFEMLCRISYILGDPIKNWIFYITIIKLILNNGIVISIQTIMRIIFN